MDRNLIDRANTYPNFKDCSIQTFNEQDKSEKSDSRIMKMSRANLERCEQLQDKKPYGVYFSVNPMNEGKRSQDDVKFIQTWICDIDSWTKEEQIELIKNAPLTPSLVVESVHGFHLYYIAEKNLTKEQYADGNRWLRNYYDGDPKVCTDTARVLRIPWYYHQKWEKVMVVYRDDLSCWEHYTKEQMELAFPNQMKVTTDVIKQRKVELKDDDGFRSRASELDNKMMLEEFSWTSWVNGDVLTFKRNSNWTEQIRCNGKSTGCWIDKNWMIGSSDHWWPTWVQWLRRYHAIDWKVLAGYLKDHHPELEKQSKKFDISKIQKQETDKEPTWFVYPSEVFDDFKCFMSGELVTIVAETNSWKTTFAMDMITRNSDLWIKWLYINLEFNVENVWKDKWLRFHGKTKENLTTLNPMTDAEKKDMATYIKRNMSKFDSVSLPSWIDLEDLEKMIYVKSQEWYELFIVDSFSKIHWNLDGNNARKNQNRVMEEMQELVQKLNVAVVMLHHTNKNGTFEWTQKIADLSNVFILIQKEKNEYWDEYRKYILSKDKFVHNTEICACYKVWKYELV